MLKLQQLAKQIRACRRCGLYKERKRAVPGEGPAAAKIMFIGEAPGAQEDLQGRPFVGAAGRFLTQELAAAGISRDRIFITSVLKCRPPANRPPKAEEIAACLPWLRQQIRLIRPKIICLLGDFALRAMLGKGYTISKHHGNVIRVAEIRFVPMPHPAAAMRFPRMKAAFRQDLARLRRLQLDSHSVPC
jgi:DNA polymerase